MQIDTLEQRRESEGLSRLRRRQLVAQGDQLDAHTADVAQLRQMLQLSQLGKYPRWTLELPVRCSLLVVGIRMCERVDVSAEGRRDQRSQRGRAARLV